MECLLGQPSADLGAHLDYGEWPASLQINRRCTFAPLAEETHYI